MINKYQQLGKKLSGKEMKMVQGGSVNPVEGCVGLGGRCANDLDCCNNGCGYMGDPYVCIYCSSYNKKCTMVS